MNESHQPLENGNSRSSQFADQQDAAANHPSAFETGSEPWVEACWRDMEHRALLGESFSADDYLALLHDSNEDLVVDLVYGEYVIRKQSGQKLHVDTIISKHAKYADSLRQQLLLDEAMSDMECDDCDDDVHAESTIFEYGGSATEAALATSNFQTNIPARIGRYTVINRVGKGAQASVYRAHDPALKRDVVIKLEPARGALPGTLYCQAEAVISANLDHPNLAPVIDTGDLNGRRYIVSRYIEGVTFDQWIQSRRPDEMQVAVVIAEVAKAIGYAHDAGTLHLDLKPQNIIIDRQQKPTVVDFGLAVAKSASSSFGDNKGMIRGTLAYMSPEQASGDSETLSNATDVFGLGATLMMGIVGRPPYQGVAVREISNIKSCSWDRALVNQSSASDAMKVMMNKALSTNPAARYRTMNELADDLQRIATPNSLKSTRRFYPLAALVGLAAMVLLLASLLLPNTIDSVIGPSESEELLSVFVQHADGNFEPVTETNQVVRTGDKIRIRGELDSSRAGVLFSISPAGQVQVLRKLRKNREHAEFSFPESGSQALPLVGNVGTEVIGLAIGDDCGVIDAVLRGFQGQKSEDLFPFVSRVFRGSYDGAIDDRSIWNDQFAQQATRANVSEHPLESQLAANSRDLGGAVEMDPGDETVRDFVHSLATELQQHEIALEAIAFPHQDHNTMERTEARKRTDDSSLSEI
ncbi:Serine/threonine-protein kinase PrkC [Planctomycetes bacterium CA13]|uniref:Serine/threonine-protein kinase PrkC n=1 Tax=Novipirellula herctigrandis TaxID=2527986 RepID=A0A5C5ZBS7_9BACT|nr:Serine/threonine-protein kinase PrkC [Planctomycetes bacterium CA13]